MFGWVDDTMTVRPNSTMLPPIWVAACDSQRRRNEALRKTASAPSDSVVLWRRRPDRSGVDRLPGSGHRPSSAAGSGRPRDRGVEGRVTALHELDEAPFERRPLQQHVPATRLAAQPDIRSEPVHEPGIAPARVAPAKPQDVAEQQGQDGSDRHGGQAIRAAVGRAPGRVHGPSRARRRDRAA